MITALLGTGAALFFGTADFLGGRAASRISPFRATALSASAGLVILLLAVPAFGGVLTPGALTWGTIGGVVASSTVVLLYASLAIGPMSVLAPLTGVIAALVPALYGVLIGERLAPIGYSGLAVALVAVVLVGLVPHREALRPRPLGLLLAACAGLSMGTGLIVLDRTPGDSGILPLVFSRVVSIGIMALWIVVAARRRTTTKSGWRGGLRWGLGAGLFAAVADVLMLIGVRVGEVSVIGVLVALCSAVTVALATIILRERLAPPQIAGLVLALVAAGLLAAG